jgi:hypothetical protein
MPLVKGRYPTTNPLWSALGQATNATNPSQPVFSNASYTGIGGLTDGAGLVTNKLVVVAIPVDVGSVITKVGFIAGATAPTTTIGYAALYSGMSTGALSALLAQSANFAAVAPTASAPYSIALASAVTITAANAPNGFVFAGFQETGTVNSAASVSVAAAVGGFAWNTGAPFSYALSVTATTGTAPATLTTPTAVTVTPLVFLS